MKPFAECTSERPSECFVLTVRDSSIYLQVVAACGSFMECPSKRPSECSMLAVRVASICYRWSLYVEPFIVSLGKTLGMFHVCGTCCLHLFIGGHCM